MAPQEPPERSTDPETRDPVALLRAANENLVRAALRAEEIAEAAQGFRILIENVKEYAIFLLDLSGNVKTWNPGAERIKGYVASEIIGKHFSVFYPEIMDNGEAREDLCRSELEEAAREGRFEGEGPRVRKDGSRFWAHVVIRALRDEQGHVVGFGKVTRDLTDRIRMEENRIELARAEAAERTKDEFLAIMGHELRNPLAPMVAAVHLLKLREGKDCEKEIAVLDRQLQQMKRLVDDLLDVSRVKHGKLRLERRIIEIREIVADAVEVASPAIEKKRHRLEIDVPDHGARVEVDPERMAQVFGNLLNNAAKFTGEGGRIRVGSLIEDGHVSLTIEDTGMGISDELKPRLFELFAQGQQGADRQLGGLGVGLAVSQKLVAEHGGTLSAESDGPGRGSRFTVRLPRVEVASKESAPLSSSSRRERPRRRVLLVDDNPDSSEMLEAFLIALGHETRIALDGEEALKLAAEIEPQIVVLDIGLPGMDGFEVARRLRQIAACSTIPIIALSGYATEEDRRKSAEAGFTAHFAKPVDLSLLERIVESPDRPPPSK
jgi:PAS domain S-box-containing protein